MMLKNAKNTKDIPSSACFVGGGEIKISDAPRGVRPDPVGSMLGVKVLSRPATMTAPTPAPKPAAELSGEQAWERQWEGDAKLRAEFGHHKPAWMAYSRAHQAGRTKIYR